MLDFIENYSFSEAAAFIVIFALALKEFFTILDWFKDKAKNAFEEEQKKINAKTEIETNISSNKDEIKEVLAAQKELEAHLKEIDKKINQLMDSDRDDIKAFLTREYHYFCEQKGWIDDYSLECCEKRFSHYVEEGGNSYIENLMIKLRALPNQEPGKEDAPQAI